MSIYSELCTDVIDFGTKNSNPRTEQITKITIHHMAGVTSGSKCAQSHRNGNVASANYYIGNGGDICGGVSEDRRAWTSSSGWNDQRAITIECSNSATGDPWPVSDAAYNSTIRLCADICKRYGIKPHYTGEKDGSLTLHCMFAATACPGPTWKSYHTTGKVENDILAAMGSQPTPEPKDDESRIWYYLLELIGNEYGVAGMMGNLQCESGLRPNNLQNTYEKSLGMNDIQYTAAVDNGSYTNFVGDKAGYGLAQWTSSGRKQGLLNMKNTRGCSIADLYLQLDWLRHELSTSYKSVLDSLKRATSVYEATVVVLTKFECPRDQSDAVKQQRTKYSQHFYDKYATGAEPVIPVVDPVRNIKYFQVAANADGYSKDAIGEDLVVDGIDGPKTQAVRKTILLRCYYNNGYPVIKCIGKTVAWLQTRVKELGFDPGTVDGYFGQKTERAVMDFQKVYGLDVDGIAGYNTLTKLFYV